ncbi:Phosducin domain-containing protein [Mycena kentingensis (nom. inval.)]|nr:Phosducin domain-containing protein [Mycena kentingensis (nom. inval.)]
MSDPLEQLVLSGKLFSNSRSSSPERAPSPDAGWHDDELKLKEDDGYDSDTVRRAAFDRQLNTNESIGMGPGRTGVKGVIRDRDEATQLDRDKHARDVAAMNRQMEKANLGGKTYLEEEREKGDDADEIVLRERERIEERRNVFGHARQGRFGHLREVGVKGFLPAVEGETKGTWIVVHLYEPSLERCYKLDEQLAQMARTYADTKFLRARASTLGFTSSGRAAAPTLPRAPRKSMQDEEDDPYDEKDIGDYDEDEDEGGSDDDVDLDMLPTMLVYRDGELVHNWVRVDWEAGQAGIEDLLDRHHILPRSTAHSRNLGLPSDDEDDLVWSDDEDGVI